MNLITKILKALFVLFAALLILALAAVVGFVVFIVYLFAFWWGVGLVAVLLICGAIYEVIQKKVAPN